MGKLHAKASQHDDAEYRIIHSELWRGRQSGKHSAPVGTGLGKQECPRCLVKVCKQREELPLIPGLAGLSLPPAQRFAELALSWLFRPRSFREPCPFRRFEARLC